MQSINIRRASVLSAIISLFSVATFCLNDARAADLRTCVRDAGTRKGNERTIYIEQCAKAGDQQKRQEFEDKQKAREELENKHRQELMAGTAAVKTLSDAILLTNAGDGSALVRQPLVNPDGKAYGLSGILERVEHGGDSLVVRVDSLAQPSYLFVELARDTKLINDAKSKLRFNYVVRVVGVYRHNRDYTTIAGQQKTGPVLEAKYLFAE